MLAVRDFAVQRKIQMHGHLAESVNEITFSMEKYGCRPYEWIRRHGLLGEGFYHAHCIHLNDEEIKHLSESKTGVVACIVFSGDARMIQSVMVNGEWVVADGKLTKVNEDEKKTFVNEVGREILLKASMRDKSLLKDLA